MSFVKINNKPYVVADKQYKGEYVNADDSYATTGRTAKMTRPIVYKTQKPETNYVYTYRNCKLVETKSEYYQVNRAYGMMPR